MAIDKDTGILFGCTFCSLVFPTKIDKNSHTMSHFQQKQCDGCNQNLICVADIWYQVHANEICIDFKEEIDHDPPIEFECVNLGEHSNEPSALHNTSEEQLHALNDIAAGIKVEQELDCDSAESDVSDNCAPEVDDVTTKNEMKVNDKLKRCRFCTASFEKRSVLARHQRHIHRDEYVKNAKYLCQTCSLPFKNEIFYIKHMLEKHNIQVERQPKGVKSVQPNDNSENLLEDNALRENEINESSILDLMDYNSTDLANVEEVDIDIFDAISNNEQPTTATKRERESNSEHRAKANSKRRMNKCDFCTAEFLKMCTLIRHERNVHRAEYIKKSPFICETCRLPFKMKYFYAKHMSEKHNIIVDAPSKTAQSQQPDPKSVKSLENSSKQTNELHQTLSTELENEPNLDNADEYKDFPLDIDDGSAMETNAESDYESEEDEESKASSSSVRAHIKVRKCDYCPATFAKLSSLMRHERNVHREEEIKRTNFICKICNLPFKVGYFYFKHMLDKHDINIETQASTEQQLDHVNDADPAADSEKSNTEKPVIRYTMSDASISRPRRCNLCPARFSASSLLLRHKLKVHSEETKNDWHLECDTCGARFKEKQFYILHLYNKHGVGDLKELEELRTIQCSFCDQRFQHNGALIRHKRSAHQDLLIGDDENKCTKCSLSFESQMSLERHIIEEHGATETENYRAAPIVPTDNAKETSEADNEKGGLQNEEQDSNTSRNAMVLRKKTEKKRKRLTCSICSMVFRNDSYLRLHRRTKHRKIFVKNPQSENGENYPDPPKKYRCLLCPMSYKNMSSLCRHKRNIHTENHRVFKCYLCVSRFPAVEKLRQHMYEDHKLTFKPTKRRYICYICTMTYGAVHLLINHLKTHPEIEYKCCIEPCTKQFATDKELYDHLLAHSRQERQAGNRKKCEICENSYTQSCFAGHTCSKSVLRKYMCDHCGKMFRCRDQLEAHINVHTGNRPFKCTICDKSFKNKNGQRAHALTHTDEKPIKCKVDGCSEAFKIHKQLHLHEFTVHGIRRRTHQCNVCDRIFPEKVWLRNHLRTHGIVMEATSTCD